MASASEGDRRVTNGAADAVLGAASAGEVEAMKAIIQAIPTAVSLTGQYSMTALHKAAINGHKEVAVVLLGARAAVDARDIGGWTPLHWAADRGHKEVMQVLLRANADEGAKDKNGGTPLQWAARHGHTHVAEVLFGVGAAFDAKDRGGWTPLHWAARHGHNDIAGVLLNAAAAVEAKDRGGWTPLHWAARQGHKPVAEVLLGATAAVDAKDRDGSTPLHFAASKGHKAVGEELLCANAAVDERNNKGETPLRSAVQARQLGMVRLLLTWGADSEDLRPRGARARLSAKTSELRDVFVQTVPMTEQQRGAVRAVRRAAVNTVNNARSVADCTSSPALVALQRAYQNFEADASTLSADVLEQALSPPRDRDVRWHALSHRILLLASRAGVFSAETPQEACLRRQFWFERVYQSALKVLTRSDHSIFDALVRVAENDRLVEPYHVSVAVMGLELHSFIVEEAAGVHRRLSELEQSMTRGVEQLREQLQKLGQYILSKEEHERKVALAKSAFKIGVSLAPVVGGVLSATVDVMAELADGLPGGAVAVVRHLADPTDLPVALEVLSLARNVEAHLSEGQVRQLSEVIQPFESVSSLEERVSWAVGALNLSAQGEGGEIIDAVSEAEGESVAGEAVSDGGRNPGYLKRYHHRVLF